MDLRNINRLSIDGNRVASISSDRYQGYIWNETYDVRFVDSEAYGSKQISAVELVYGIDDSFPDVKYQSPYSNYAFDGWEPAIHPGELVSDDITCSAHYEYDGKTVILLFDENNGGQTNRRYADASKNVLIADKVRPDTLRPGTVEWKTPDMLSVQVGEIHFGDDIQSIDDYLMMACPTVSSVSFSNNVKSIGTDAFRQCQSLNGEIHFPDSILSIGNYAFFFCNNLSGNVEFPDNIANIGDYAFKNCGGIRSVTIPGSLSVETSLGTGVFQEAGISAAVIQDGVKYIPAYIFDNCYRLQRVEIPSSLVAFHSRAFNRCTALERVDIANGVEWGHLNFDDVYSNPLYYARYLYQNGDPVREARTSSLYAFNNCFTISSAVIHPGLSSFYRGSVSNPPFVGCQNLTKITTQNPYFGIVDGCVVGMNPSARDYHRIVQGINGDENFNVVLSNVSTVSAIGDYSFSELGNLRGVTIQGTSNSYITEIDNSAFSRCNMLSSVELNKLINLKRIGSSAFGGCSGLVDIVFPSNDILSVDSYAFSNCVNLSSVGISGSSITLGNFAFQGCKNIINITFGSSMQLGRQVFSNCTGLQYIGIVASHPNMVSIGINAFATGNDQTQVYFPNMSLTDVQSIPNYPWGIAPENIHTSST